VLGNSRKWKKKIVRPACKLGPVAMCWALKENRRGDTASMCRLSGIYVVGTRNNESGSNVGTWRKWKKGTKHPVCPAVRWLAWLYSMKLCHELFSRDRTVLLLHSYTLSTVRFARKCRRAANPDYPTACQMASQSLFFVYGTVVGVIITSAAGSKSRLGNLVSNVSWYL
jgi:hypothetical protein